jgi:hypothetical protein
LPSFHFRLGDVLRLFGGTNYSSLEPLVIHRVKKLALICVQTVHQKRHDWGSQLLMPPESTPKPCGSLLETAACLINPKLAWNCKVVGYLQRKKIYCLFRGIIISIPVSCVSVLRFCICLLSVPTPFRLLVDQNVLISDKSTFY